MLSGLSWLADRQPPCAGLFVPGILVGAAYGRLIGVFVSAYHPRVDESTYALLGSASYMAGSMRLVVSVCVMLLELTNQLSLLPIMMLVVIVAKAVGEGSGVPGIYAILTRVKAFPVLTTKPDKALRHVTAADLAAHEGEPHVLARVEQVGAIVAKLRACSHNGFPVLDCPLTFTRGGALAAALQPPAQRSDGAGTPRGPSHLLGVVLRHHLLVLLRSGRAFQHSPVVTHNAQRIAFMYSVTDFDKPVSQAPLTIEAVAAALSPQALAMYIDLAPYVNPPSYTVQASTCAWQTYHLFKSLGLRHLCVVPDTHAVLGVITRKDLVPEHAQDVISNKLWSGADDGSGGGGAGGTAAGLASLQLGAQQRSGALDASVELQSAAAAPRPSARRSSHNDGSNGASTGHQTPTDDNLIDIEGGTASGGLDVQGRPARLGKIRVKPRGQSHER